MGEKTLQLFSLQGGGGSGPALGIAEQTGWRAKGLSPLLSTLSAFPHVSPTTRHPTGSVCQVLDLPAGNAALGWGEKRPLENRDLEVKCQSAKKKCYLHKGAQKIFLRG